MTRKGLLTTQRKVIYEIVKQAKDHPTAADIMERLKQGGYSFAYGTVYNSLRYLTEAGMIRELQLEGDASRYDGHVEDHQHVICRLCGKVDEVYTVVPTDWVATVANETGYDIEMEHVVFKGVCPQCQNATKDTNL
ncbi:Fur family transcriptional regulator [Paenibacillus sp. 481]|uniref:Fur family transcriptional regulator n=1 Tax=Paenibacillus sp. 481 TaxID=2835869 RepID=UPI001E58D021|nr:transcriptional repressor [Paenibacillus sp. 481]UHA72772.1 transcriptional repressor [Paenibacillus sp. 481]